MCLKTCMTISTFQICFLFYSILFCILDYTSTIRIFHELSWIHLKKKVALPDFLQEKPEPVFPERKKKKKYQLKDSFPTAILYLVKLHDSSFLEILQ